MCCLCAQLVPVVAQVRECIKCRHICCFPCLQEWQKQQRVCPAARCCDPIFSTLSPFAREQIDKEVFVRCLWCQQTPAFSKFIEHQKKCAKRPLQEGLKRCEYFCQQLLKDDEIEEHDCTANLLIRNLQLEKRCVEAESSLNYKTRQCEIMEKRVAEQNELIKSLRFKLQNALYSKGRGSEAEEAKSSV